MLEALTAPMEHGQGEREPHSCEPEGRMGKRVAHGVGVLWTRGHSQVCLGREGGGTIQCLPHSPSGAPVYLQDQRPGPHEAHGALCDMASALLQPHASWSSLLVPMSSLV